MELTVPSFVCAGSHLPGSKHCRLLAAAFTTPRSPYSDSRTRCSRSTLLGVSIRRLAPQRPQPQLGRCDALPMRGSCSACARMSRTSCERCELPILASPPVPARPWQVPDWWFSGCSDASSPTPTTACVPDLNASVAISLDGGSTFTAPLPIVYVWTRYVCG
jgi:hypothetical protein